MATQRVPKPRSPNYPALNLAAAIGAVKSLYPKVGRGEFTSADAARAWGYKSASGPLRSKVAALKQYGLIEQRRGGNAKLSTRALTLALRAPASMEYTAALGQAALEPPLFRELYESGKHTTAADALRQHLIVERAFTSRGAAQVIEVARASLGLADLDASTSGRQEGKIEAKEEKPENQPPPPPKVHMDTLQIPLPGTAWATLTGPFPLTEAAWKQMIVTLDAMAPALVLRPQAEA
ncbi:MAG: hypothetical protein EXR55_01455 [Dehalococcoidia bacterium]|nr:hypothetical protein [Dehalococcoidia bacterium]